MPMTTPPSIHDLADLAKRHRVTPYTDMRALVNEILVRWAVPSKPQLTDATAQREAVRQAIADALGDAYDCTRHWSAWSYNTMSPDDFQLVAEDDARVDEITDAAMLAFYPKKDGE